MALKPKQVVRSIVPPLLWDVGKDLKRRLVRSVDHFAYAPAGWSTRLPEGDTSDTFWSTLALRERVRCQALIAAVQRNDPAVTMSVDIKDALFGYVLALTAGTRATVSVLDYGGHLGEHYWVGKALVPGVDLDYHCKDIAPVAAAGRELSPLVKWHSHDACLDRPYDLVLFSSSLQCVREWQRTLDRAARASRRFMFLSDVPTVRTVHSYVITHRCEGITTLQHQLNHSEIIGAVERAGLRLICEFDMGPHPPIANAPEQPRLVGLLFQRVSESSA